MSWDDAAAKEFPAPWDPEPTPFTGGLERMIKLWEKARDANDGGYGSNRLFKVGKKGGGGAWASNIISSKTSCSPFTGIMIGMLYDPDGGESKEIWEPKYDGAKKTPIPPIFYGMHNGNFVARELDKVKQKKVLTAQSIARINWFSKNKFFDSYKTKGAYGVNDSAHSLVWWGLGYEIDPRDMRRGDMIGIDWVSTGGHATFCWDVHLDEQGAVDCFLYLSSNGGARGGAGVSVGTWPPNLIVQKSGNGYKKSETVFEDKDKYITNGSWMCLPNVRSTDVKRETFKKWPGTVVGKDNGGQHAVASLRVTRLYGFPPPETPHGNLLQDGADARKYAKYPAQPGPYSNGSCEPPGRGKVTTKKVPKSNPEPKKAVAPEPAQQKKEEALPHQQWVEGALSELFAAKWIDKDPGKPDAYADAQSKAAIEEFQTKWKLASVDGQPGPKTRAALKKAIDDLHAGKPNPHDKTERKPAIESMYWSPNSVDAGGTTNFGVKGENLDLVKAYEVSLKDAKTGASETVTLHMVAANGAASERLKVPAKFAAGSTLEISLKADGIQKTSGAHLYIKKAEVKAVAAEWLWDEKKWPASMTDMLKQLRLVQKQANRELHARQITQYGVWDRISAGDTPVLDKSGRTIGKVDKKSLYLADLEGTMRLNGRILNLIASGNVYDAQMGRAPFEKFDPKKSKWVDVTDDAPFGMGAKMPLIPFRTLAHNAAKESGLYGKKVFVEQLNGLKLPTGEVHNGMCVIGDAGALEAGKQFDLFVGPESNRISLPATCNVEILR